MKPRLLPNPHPSTHEVRAQTSTPPLCPPQLMIFNAVATVLYVTAFVTCAAAVQPTSWRQWDYNRRAAASVSSGGQVRVRGWGGGCAHAWAVLLFQFFACLVMITYAVSTFFSFRAWKGLGSNAATSQVTDHA